MKAFPAAAILVLATGFLGCARPATTIEGPVIPNGEYVGLESMPNLTPEDKNAHWFHENRLLVRNDEAILDKSPVIIRHGVKEYSASDGGFFTYRAEFSAQNGHAKIRMRLFRSDYVVFIRKNGTPSDPYKEVKTFPVSVTPSGLEFADVTYKPAKLQEHDSDYLLQLLGSEPLQESKVETEAEKKH